MHIKVDEDLPPIVAQWLENEGYSASTVVQQRMGGWKDHALWQVVRADKHFLLTADKGFADIRSGYTRRHSAFASQRRWDSAASLPA